MSKEQIEEMGFIIQENSPLSKISSEDVAEILYNAGYRKQSEPFSRDHEKGGEWISVDERLPEPKTDVLVLFVDGGVTMDFRMPGHGFMYGNDVTHWMPLPEPPKMKGGAE